MRLTQALPAHLRQGRFWSSDVMAAHRTFLRGDTMNLRKFRTFNVACMVIGAVALASDAQRKDSRRS